LNSFPETRILTGGATWGEIIRLFMFLLEGTPELSTRPVAVDAQWKHFLRKE
jgi:hypothetical protein